MRRAAKIDANQPEIVKGLRQAGASVACCHAVGDGFTDLVVGFRGVNYLVEVKDGEKVPSKRKLTPDQVKFHAAWTGQIGVAETLDEALEIIGAKRRIG